MKPNPVKQTKHRSFRLPVYLIKDLERLAAKARRSVNQYVTHVLLDHVHKAKG